MEPCSVTDDAEFWLPTEFLTDDDFLVEKENNAGGGLELVDDSFSYEPRLGFGASRSTVKPNNNNAWSMDKQSDDEKFLAGLTRQMVQSSLEDDFSGGFCGDHSFPAGNNTKALGMNRSPLCVAGTGCCCQTRRSNQNCNSRVSSWDLYCAAAEEVARMSIIDEHYHSSDRGLLALPTKLSSSVTATAVKNNPSNGTGYYSHRQSLPYQKLQAIQLKQQQLMKHHHHHRQLVHQSRGVRLNNSNGNKNVGGPVDLSSSAWSNYQLPRRDVMRAVFIGDQTGKRGSTGTGVFLPRSVNHSSSRAASRDDKPTLSTVLVPARLTQVLNLNVGEPVRSFSGNLNDVSWRQRSNNGGFSSQLHGGVRAEQPVNEPRLPSEWAY
ncbi:PREDICTED: uncharacterized protein LOC104781261 isoform X2 [Camelina sativa]|uniref:Uncharacterized protein LOC104781261 isoform X2 n=1 Tax=Camelina sativa TaxID=90675 RepID=A0ABM0YPX6_CAMSA|nr:PREDICTED: uncharacterized protein LOC104781261 isoform X2 [Camelina sativa]